MIFRYCNNCASQNFSLIDRHFKCANCGFEFYLAPASCNGAILENSLGEILLAKRKSEPFKGYWDLPGGFVDWDETSEQAVLRELKEELGADIKNIKYFKSYFDRYFFMDINYHVLCSVFTAKISDEKLKAADDITEIKFFPKNKIPWNKLAFNLIKKSLEDYLKLS